MNTHRLGLGDKNVAREMRKKMRTPTERACYFRRSMALTSMVSRILITSRDFRQSMALVTLILKRIRDMKQGATIVTLMTGILKKKNKFKRSITPMTLILKEMTNYKKMPQTLWHEEMWFGSF
jgi:secreted Zn-dependent insulinase-like peptidase